MQTNFPLDVPTVGDYQDILLQNITHNHLQTQISGILKHKYLTPHNNNTSIAKGILFGPHARPLVCLPVMSLSKKENIAIHFLVDTGTPITHLSEEALKVLFKIEDLALIDSMNVNIWGEKLPVSLSENNFQGINLLGADYLRKANIKLECIYNNDPEKEFFCLTKLQQI